ncbi:MAG: site-specific integrase [Saprospiraceae bacterium]|nr:site-specific integrase [Saprospiraceae bacterium]
MSKIRYYLKASDSAGESLISLYFSFNDKRLVYSTGLKVPPDFWNTEKQRAKESRKFPQFPELNARLDNLAHETLNIYRRFLNDGKLPSVAQMKSELDAYTLRGATAGETSLFGFIEQFIKERESQPKFSPNTIKTYRTTFNHLKAFAAKKRRPLDFADIDLDFFFDFQEFLFTERTDEKGKKAILNQNSASKTIGVLKAMLNEATERGINKNTAYKSRRFSIGRVEVQNIYLSIDELTRLYRLHLEGKKSLDKVRDLFLVGAFTGLRFSDFTNIRPENVRTVDGGQQIQMTTQKTGEAVAVPVHPIVRAILEKHKGQPPKPLSNQKMNDYLKELAKLAGITDAVVLTKNRAGKRFDRRFEKWELVTTHTARRSFATNAFKAGIPSISIMKITGHRTEAAFMKYIKISKEENAILISQSDFFRVSPLKVVAG